MSRSDDQRIVDILEYADKVASAVEKGHHAFLHECKGKYPEVNWAEIIGLRTRLAHIYHRIDNENIWGAASIDVPHLAKVLRQM